jgi:hypothetical protein
MIIEEDSEDLIIRNIPSKDGYMQESKVLKAFGLIPKE